MAVKVKVTKTARSPERGSESGKDRLTDYKLWKYTGSPERMKAHMADPEYAPLRSEDFSPVKNSKYSIGEKTDFLQDKPSAKMAAKVGKTLSK